jgi:carbonic anhydrase
MQKLIDGIHRFQNRVFPSKRVLFEQLAAGQHPEVLLITCSDSRICPDLIMQSQPGDLFVLRNAGNIVPPYGRGSGSEDATIEFAVAKLGIREIIVCGHLDCGAMKALVTPETCQELPALRAWLSRDSTLRATIHAMTRGMSPGRQLRGAIEANVLLQLGNLRTHPVIARGLDRKLVSLHGLVYDIATGLVLAYDPLACQFVSLHQCFGGSKPRGASEGSLPI